MAGRCRRARPRLQGTGGICPRRGLGERSGARRPERGSEGGRGEGGKGEGARPHGVRASDPSWSVDADLGGSGPWGPVVAGLRRDSVRLSDRCPVLLPGPARPAQVVRDQMRQVQHRLQQERLRDARPRQGVPHRVLPLRGLQPPAHPGRRVRAARGRALLPRGPRRGGEGQPGRRRPAQPPAPGAPAADGRYARPSRRRQLRGRRRARPPTGPRAPAAAASDPGGRGRPGAGCRGHRVAWGAQVPCARGPGRRRPHTCGSAHGNAHQVHTGRHTPGQRFRSPWPSGRGFPKPAPAPARHSPRRCLRRGRSPRPPRPLLGPSEGSSVPEVTGLLKSLFCPPRQSVLTMYFYPFVGKCAEKIE